LLRAKALVAMGREADAKADLDAAASQGEKSFAALAGVATIQMQLGDWEEAARRWSQAIEVDGESVRALRNRATCRAERAGGLASCRRRPGSSAAPASAR
jgi:hypothetical protein